MARATKLDGLESEVRQLRADNASLLADLVEARKLRDLFRDNSLRKESVIQMLQKKVQRLEKPSDTCERPVSERRAAMNRAKNEAMAEGRCVTVSL